MVVEDEHLVDAGVLADERDDVALPVAVAPDHARCSRAGWRSWRRRAAAPRARPRSAGANAGSSRPSRSASSAPSPESPPEQVRIAEAARRAGGRRGRRVPWRARAGRATSSAHAAPASRDERAEHALVAGERAGVGRRRGGADRRARPTFSTATPMPASAHAASASHSARAVAGVLDAAARPSRTSGSRREVASQSAVVTHRLVPGRDRGVQAQPAAGGERVDDEVAALGDQRRRAPARAALERVAPQRGAGVERDEAVAVRAADGERVPEGRARDSSRLAARGSARALAEAGREDDRSSAPQRSAPRRSGRGRAAAGIATTTASGADGRSASDGKHGKPWADARFGLTPQTSPSKPARRRLTQRLARRTRRARSVAPTTATVRGWSRRARSTSVERALDAAPLERAGDDQALDLARALPDAVDAQLAQEALGDVGRAGSRGRRTPAPRGRRSGTRPRSRTASPSTPSRARSSGPRRRRRAARPRASARGPRRRRRRESASGNETPW